MAYNYLQDMPKQGSMDSLIQGYDIGQKYRQNQIIKDDNKALADIYRGDNNAITRLQSPELIQKAQNHLRELEQRKALQGFYTPATKDQYQANVTQNPIAAIMDGGKKPSNLVQSQQPSFQESQAPTMLDMLQTGKIADGQPASYDVEGAGNYLLGQANFDQLGKLTDYQKAIGKDANDFYNGLTESVDENGKPILLAMTKKGAVPSGYAPRPKDGKPVPVVRNGQPVTVKVPGTNEVKILMSDNTYTSGGSIPIIKPEPKERPEQYWPDDGLQGQPFLDTMTAAMAARVKSIAGGRSKLPSYAAMRRDPTLAKIVEAVYKYDPTYEEQRYGNRYFAQKSYLPGQKNGMLILSNASALGHMQVLREAYNAMKNGDLKAINSIANRYKVQTGSAPEAVFNAIKGVIGAEVMKSIVPGGGGVVEREEVRETLSREYSNDQFMGTLGGYEALMQEQYDNMKQDYERNDLDPKLWPTYKTHDEKKADKARGGGDKDPYKITKDMNPKYVDYLMAHKELVRMKDFEGANMLTEMYKRGAK